MRLAAVDVAVAQELEAKAGMLQSQLTHLQAAAEMMTPSAERQTSGVSFRNVRRAVPLERSVIAVQGLMSTFTFVDTRH